MAYFFSVVMAAPERLAALRADWLRTTVSRAAPPVRTFLPILTASVSQPDIVTDLIWVWFGVVVVVMLGTDKLEGWSAGRVNRAVSVKELLVGEGWQRERQLRCSSFLVIYCHEAKYASKR